MSGMCVERALTGDLLSGLVGRVITTLFSIYCYNNNISIGMIIMPVRYCAITLHILLIYAIEFKEEEKHGGHTSEKKTISTEEKGDN